MLELNGIEVDEIEVLWDQFKTIRDSIKQIDAGAAYLSLHTSTRHIDLDHIFDDGAYLKQIRSDLLYYRQDLRRQIIELLADEDRIEQGYLDNDSDWVEPFPIGTPKSDHRRSGVDTE